MRWMPSKGKYSIYNFRDSARENGFIVYLGGTVTGDGRSDADVRRRTQADVNPWKKVEGLMADKKIPIRSGDGSVEEQQQRMQVCENSCIKRIVGV